MKMLAKIASYNTIILHRHVRPDLDAIGSQFGLKHILMDNYQGKDIYAVGDTSKQMYLATLDTITDDKYQNALVIVLDCANEHMISDDRYKLATEVIIIDHHENEPNINHSLFIENKEYISTTEIIIDFIRYAKYKVSALAATYLYGGLVTDSGRFLHVKKENASRVFLNASYICQFQPNIQDLYNYLYTETLEERQNKQLFASFNVTPKNVAYRFNTKEIVEESGLDFFTINRGMVNLMGGIKEVPIWVSFTYENNSQKVFVEIRSRGIRIVDVAKKYGGGGHEFACGCSIDSFLVAKDVLEDLDRLV